VAWAKCDVIEDPAVLAERDFSVGTSVKVIENWPGKAATSQGPEVANTDDVGRCYCTFRSGHFLNPVG
jgi:hypothetical protein